jgi:hypothetical protein
MWMRMVLAPCTCTPTFWFNLFHNAPHHCISPKQQHTTASRSPATIRSQLPSMQKTLLVQLLQQVLHLPSSFQHHLCTAQHCLSSKPHSYITRQACSSDAKQHTPAADMLDPADVSGSARPVK